MAFALLPCAVLYGLAVGDLSRCAVTTVLLRAEVRGARCGARDDDLLRPDS